MKIDLIPATEKDRIFFREVHHIAYRDVIELMFGWNEEYQDNAADRDFDTRNPHIIKYLGVDVGVIGWQDKTDFIWFGPIFVLPSYQNKGIGTALISNFMEKAEDENRPLRLQTLKGNNRAKQLYEKLGFCVLCSDQIHWQLEYTPTRRRFETEGPTGSRVGARDDAQGRGLF